MKKASLSKRTICSECEYIISRCLCDTIKSINNSTHVIILQHQSETKHALNTTHILRKCLTNITILIGENFSQNQELNSIIENFGPSIGLIFPTSKAQLLNKVSAKPLTHLILIDGTWKKSRKIYMSSPNLHSLMTFSLQTTVPSTYRIRSSDFPNSLSTLEATIHALSLTEENLNTDSIKNSFDKMIQMQIDSMGEEIFRKNYLKEE